jgi:hypothetical protein
LPLVFVELGFALIVPIAFKSKDHVVEGYPAFEMVIPGVVGFVGLSRCIVERLPYEGL